MLQLDPKFQRIIVTGGAGFIGSHICEELLKQGRTVLALDNLTNSSLTNIQPFLNLYPNQFQFHQVDINHILDTPNHLKLFKDIDLVFHNACSKCTVCVTDPHLDLETNAWGTFNVLKASKIHNVSKFVHASSGSVYGDPLYFPEDENHPTHPNSFYGTSKLAGEKYVQVFAKNYNLDATIIRYFHVFGSRQQHHDLGGVIPIFINKIYHNLPLTVYGDGSQIRLFTSVKDIVKGNIFCANPNSNQIPIYNCCSGVQVTIQQLLDMILNQMKTLGYSYNTNLISYKDWKEGDIRHFDVSNTRLTDQGFEFRTDFPEALYETILEYIHYFKNNSTTN